MEKGYILKYYVINRETNEEILYRHSDKLASLKEAKKKAFLFLKRNKDKIERNKVKIFYIEERFIESIEECGLK